MGSLGSLLSGARGSWVCGRLEGIHHSLKGHLLYVKPFRIAIYSPPLPKLSELRSSEEGRHHFCSAASQNVTYKELKNLLHSKSTLLIDVREPWEILEHGQIPGFFNIPLGEIDQALQMNSEDFKEKYNQDMPSKSDNLIFSCLAGVRSKKALTTALSLGYKSARHYPGGWKEWESYEYPEKKKMI
ncbi:thiosulfate sulfurtransferase/rhodanese-like domain-containing protein 3 isoform X1 [Macrotis lagotis]|uniref:thiosulfate sulfurtransferase/rhodanese-like domain-containing protein 3 isoform X1 n=1 Tax=Macrotis lagotis TaxID=92651 RepID=UPI003D6934EE